MDTFKEYTVYCGDKYLVFERARLSEYINYFNQSVQYFGVIINRPEGFIESDISFLKELNNLRGLILVDDHFDTSFVNELRSLKCLQINKINSVLDLSLLTSLEEFRGDWDKRIINLYRSVSLKKLYMCGFKPKNSCLTEIGMLPNLKSLELVQGNISALTGIEGFKNLEFLGLYYLRNLVDLSALNGAPSKLEKIHFESCKKISDYSALSHCKSLICLNIEKSAAIDNVSFVHELSNLQQLFFVNTPMDQNLYGQLVTPSMQKVINTKANCIFNKNGKVDNTHSGVLTQAALTQRKAIAIAAIKKIVGTEADTYGVTAFVQHHLDELPSEYWREHLGTDIPDLAAILNCLELVSHWDNDLVFDFSLPGSVTDYVISVRFDKTGNPIDISMES